LIDLFWKFAQTLTVTQDLFAIPTPIKAPLDQNNYTRAQPNQSAPEKHATFVLASSLKQIYCGAICAQLHKIDNLFAKTQTILTE
jgi:hypothetical protein